MSTTTDWAAELRQRKALYDKACAELAHAKQHHRDVVVRLTYDLPIAEVASLSGWSVAYLRRLRGEGPQEGLLSRTTYTPQRLIHDAREGIERSEESMERHRYSYISYMREITQPALSMSDVAEVVGVSRQRVSQLLSSLED
jgi:DNA-binding phage protein